VDRAQFEAALAPLRGAIEQVPPMYSALKKEGRPLYEYAREGREVVRRARSVVVTRLEVVAFENPAAVIDIECSKGTYVRSLVDDMGQALGCGAAMTALCRTRVGPFVLGQARRLGSLLARCSG
jgi:tRNA pseudouridine55 synthase